MKILAAAMVVSLLCADGAEAAWLLWKHSWVTRRVEGKPRGLAPDGNLDKWDLLNAVELRQECVAALRVEHKKSVDSLVAIYPNEPVSQSIVADGVGATVSTDAELGGGTAAKTTQLYYEYTFWCLPAGVDPRITRSVPERK